jgi:hypothetical protein
MLKTLGMFATCIGVLSTAACTVLDHAPRQAFDNDARWALLPMSNYTETPLAGARMTEIAGALLASTGPTDIVRYVPSDEEDPFIGGDSHAEHAKAMAWAKQQNARYAVTGAATEWRYKVGVEGEPAVGVSIRIIDLETGKSVWSGAGAKSGWARDSVSGVALELIRELLSEAGI